MSYELGESHGAVLFTDVTPGDQISSFLDSQPEELDPVDEAVQAILEAPYADEGWNSDLMTAGLATAGLVWVIA